LSTAVNKKFELMLTRCAQAYSSSCSKLSVYLQPLHCSSLLECALQPKIAKINKKPFRLRSHRHEYEYESGVSVYVP